MRNLVKIGLFLLVVAVCAEGLAADTTSSPVQKIAEIESVAILGQPLIFGGYSFYADRKGRVIYQSIEPGSQKAGGLIEERFVLRGQVDLFANFVEHLQPVDLLSYSEGRERGIPDELWLEFKLTLSNGTKIIAAKWDSEQNRALDELLVRMQTAISVIKGIRKPITMPYYSNDFGAHSRILASAPAAWDTN